MKQIKVAIADETKAYLDDEARRNGRNLSEEVRVRIERSQLEDRFDAPTRELARDLMWLAHMISEGSKWALPEGATWSRDRRLFQAYRVAVDVWLSDLARRLDLQPMSEQVQLDPVTLGKSTAHGYAEIKPMLIKNRPGGDNMEGKQ